VLLVHTSNFWDNPFDLAVVDHCSHFVVPTLAGTVARAGFEVIDRNDDWIAKELGVIGRRSNEAIREASARPAEIRRGTELRLRWLGRVVDQARALPSGAGIFGTAIAGTWLASMAPETVGFFVDEDRQRTGKSHLGHPVLHAEAVPARRPVYLAFPPPVAEKIRTRLRPHFPDLELVAPLAYEAA
jgi:hypothetical protein